MDTMETTWSSPIAEWAMTGAHSRRALWPRRPPPVCTRGQRGAFSQLLLRTDAMCARVPTSGLVGVADYPYPDTYKVMTEAQMDHALAETGMHIDHINWKRETWGGLSVWPSMSTGMQCEPARVRLDDGPGQGGCGGTQSRPATRVFTSGEDVRARKRLRRLDRTLGRLDLDLHMRQGRMELTGQVMQLGLPVQLL